MLLKESNVFYTFDVKKARISGLKGYVYNWSKLVNESLVSKGYSVVYVQNEQDLNTLLKTWNSKDPNWKYWEFDQYLPQCLKRR